MIIGSHADLPSVLSGVSIGPVNPPSEEARHAIAVLRVSVGDEVVLFDGAGREATGRVARTDRKRLTVEVSHVERRPVELSRQVTLAVGMPRTHRQGYLVEKCTELGVGAIWPIDTDYTVTRPGSAAVEKWRRRAIEAAKQAERAWIPTIVEPQSFESALKRIAEFNASSLTDTGPSLPSFRAFLASVPAGCPVLVWVGPEGGWSETEARQAVEAGAVRTTLGPTVLRTETAAVAVCAAAAMLDTEENAEKNRS